MTKSIHGVFKEIMADSEPDDHVTVADLVDYQDHLLSVAEMERIRGHLTICKRCTGELLDLQKLAEGELEGGSIEGIRRPWWQILIDRLRQVAFNPAFAWSCAGITLFVLASLWLQLHEWRKPTVNVVLHDLFPVDSLVKSTAETQSLLLQPGTRHTLLVLHPETELTHTVYQVRLERGTRVLWTSDQLQPEAGIFTLLLPRSLLLMEPERIVLLGLGDTTEKLAEFPLEVSTGSNVD